MCDIRATNPKQWNSWKDNLLLELYNKTAQVLQQGIDSQANRQDDIDHNRTYALRTLSKEGYAALEVRELWNSYTEDYFFRHTPDEIAWHTKLIMGHEDMSSPLVETRVDDRTGSIDLFVIGNDIEHLFVRVVSTLGQLNLNVASAFIMRCKQNCLMETYKIIFSQDMKGQLKDYAKELIPQIITKLQQPLPDDDSIASLPRVQKHFQIDTIIDFTEVEGGMMTRMHVESADRPGLLDIIARTLIMLDIRLHNAKVSTAGEKAVDYFDLTNKSTKEPLTSELQESLKQALLEKL
jgi:[protein-PII] uridylyltransferase